MYAHPLLPYTLLALILLVLLGDGLWRHRQGVVDAVWTVQAYVNLTAMLAWWVVEALFTRYRRWLLFGAALGCAQLFLAGNAIAVALVLVVFVLLLPRSPLSSVDLEEERGWGRPAAVHP